MRSRHEEDNMSHFPRIEIRTAGQAPSAFTEIYVDGHKLEGVRRFTLSQEAGNSAPMLTIDLNAFDCSTDCQILKIRQEGYGDIRIVDAKSLTPLGTPHVQQE